MIPPETGLVMAEMGVDVIAVNADSGNLILPSPLADRSANYTDPAGSNKQANEGIYIAGYQEFPSVIEAPEEVIDNLTPDRSVRSRTRGSSTTSNPAAGGKAAAIC